MKILEILDIKELIEVRPERGLNGNSVNYGTLEGTKRNKMWIHEEINQV